MAIIHIQHTLQGFSGEPADRFVNTFTVVTEADPTPATLQPLANALVAFYSQAAMGNYLAKAGAAPGRSIQMYNLAEAKPRVPIFEQIDTAPPYTNAVTPLPAEVACCLSFEGTQISGLPQSRRRGRIYLGPLTTNAADAATTTPYTSRPAQSFINDVLGYAETLRADWSASGALWSIYSPLTPLPSTAQAIHWWMDNAWDTQRRRGARPTVSTGFIDDPGP